MKTRHTLAMFAVIVMATTLTLTGCGADGGGGAKGAEDDEPVDGKTDSFRNPTEHGSLRAGAASATALSTDEKYHSWEFKLSGAAAVTLTVNGSDKNLDTVMYLYKRANADSNWGRYIKKNDDAGGRLQSAISADLTEALYRVIVKGFKRAHTGPFSLEMGCDGAGCDAGNGGGAVDVPGSTPFTQGCIDTLWQSMGSKVVSTSGFQIHPDAVEGFDKEILVANAHYGDLTQWQEYVYEDERAEFTFDASLTRLANGAVVRMEDGGDESTTDYAFDKDGNLLSFYVHNQSPWTDYFCGAAGDEEAEPPDDECLSRWVNIGPRASAITTVNETYEPGAPNDEIDALMGAAVARYSLDELEGEDIKVTIESNGWESPDGDQGADLLLSAEDHAMISYTVVSAEWDDGPWVVFSSSENGEGSEMPCWREER